MHELPLRDITVHDENCVRRVPIFAGLTAAQQDLVATMARPRILADGELVHGVGEQTGSMFVVHSGAVKVSRLLPSGRKHRKTMISAICPRRRPGRSLAVL